MLWDPRSESFGIQGRMGVEVTWFRNERENEIGRVGGLQGDLAITQCCLNTEMLECIHHMWTVGHCHSSANTALSRCSVPGTHSISEGLLQGSSPASGIPTL